MVGSMGFLRAEMFSEGGAASGIAEYPPKEDQSWEKLSVLRRSDLAGRCMTFLNFGKIVRLSS